MYESQIILYLSCSLSQTDIITKQSFTDNKQNFLIKSILPPHFHLVDVLIDHFYSKISDITDSMASIKVKIVSGRKKSLEKEVKETCAEG